MIRSLALIVVLGFTAFSIAAPKPVPSSVDKDERAARPTLNRPIADLRLQGVALTDALDFLRDTTGANVHVNWKALEAAGVAKDTPITTRLTNIPLRKALTYVLAEADAANTITWYLDGGVIEVTTRELADKVMITRVYPVDDLLVEVPDFIGPQFDLQQASQSSSSRGGGGGSSLFSSTNNNTQPGATKSDRANSLVQLITETIRPDIWRSNGGTASITYFNGMLVVTAPRSVHEAIAGR